MEKVSVIVPVYNGEKSIERCAGSILNQDYPELELILVDDGSRDRSWEIIQAIAAADQTGACPPHETGPLPRRVGRMCSSRMWMTGCQWTQQRCWCGRWKHNRRSSW